MSVIFKTVSWRVDSLVSSVENGAVQLPDLQRPFVWPATKVRDLFDSMYRGYPVGELMFWDVAAAGETRSISGNDSMQAAHQIVDGQQRLTSLFAAIKGKNVLDENYRSKEIAISFNPFTEKFEVRTPALAKSAQWIENISTYFEAPIRVRKDFIKRHDAATSERLGDDAEEALEAVFSRLHDLQNYTFDVVHIQKDVDKRTVADIFVRINSEGVSLKAYDYILTWLSVFWPEGREQIEAFARRSRLSPAHASEVTGEKVSWTAKNPYLDVETGHLIRTLVAIGQNRAKLSDAYNALQAKDRVTGMVDANRQERELQLLRDALPTVMNPLHWQEFIRSIQTAGFRSRKGITSSTNIVAAYIFFLLGRTRYGVDLQTLRTMVGRWLFMSQLTSRYTGSGESQLQKDLDRFAELRSHDASGFIRIADEVIANELTPDFWAYRMPDALVTSSMSLSPAYQCYLAALNILDADMFMLRMSVRDWMDPSLPSVKGMEGHHLFPRKYQENVLGTSDIKRINQAANFAPTDWDTNILISDRNPGEYWPQLVTDRGQDSNWLAKQGYWHALPANWEVLDYDEFLQQRRRLIAQVTQDAFAKLSTGTGLDVAVRDLGEPAGEILDLTLAQLLERSVLRAGDNLDPVDPAWVVDATISDDGNIVIDGTHEFDSLDEAAHHLGVTNVTGLEFWALETDDGPMPLAALSR